ncbi:Signal transduction histidine kinase [Lachnospiraceae bacterium]|nr:Signal transduction histidine kinase [Lachnospiraceae bacterium]
MNKKLLFFALLYIIIILIISHVVISQISASLKEYKGNDNNSGSISVEMNEIKQLINSGETDKALEKCDEIADRSDDNIKEIPHEFYMMWILTGINILAFLFVILYVNKRILKPFEDMKGFANEISKGNLDVEIKMDRENYFGDFTWAFNNMRKEINKSRNAEKTAIENNKTVIATLSHDIKTPMASIRAYAEAFEANMDSTPEKRQKYLNVLMQKCDEVSKLTNDLFIHSISEMNRLEVKSRSIDIVRFLDEDVRELFTDSDDVEIILPQEKAEVSADPVRLLQVIENLKSNSDKYAKTKIEIKLETENGTRILFRDFGPGIPDEEIPFITGKFYRGKNSANENGSGLGLYIVQELVQKMGGKIKLLNKDPGFEVIITLQNE